MFLRVTVELADDDKYSSLRREVNPRLSSLSGGVP